MLQIKSISKLNRKTIQGPGFSLKVPINFNTRCEIDPHGQWGYSEFFQVDNPDQHGNLPINAFFYYWENNKTSLSEKQTPGIIEILCKEKVFTGDHSLEKKEIFPVHFKRNTGFICKYRFCHHDPEAEGKVNFYMLHNPLQKKVVVLGLIIQSTGSQQDENENMAWFEDQIISTFNFKKHC
ncbi:MAG: hypothetical protein MUF15_02990 [Acidobacteria bacterium]|jgi:hypothetical protein|nr:hypothetical protein [Acidobacteriota bacterium]